MDDHEYQEKWREEERKQIFRHQQQLGELWTDPEKEKYNDRVMGIGMGIGAGGFLICCLAGNAVLGIAVFLLCCLGAAGFMK
jgi:hypothetical protein